MPLTAVHFNGGVNLDDTETVLREIAARVPTGVRRIPDGETGERQQWIFFQLQKFWETPGVEQDEPVDRTEGYVQMPKVRLGEGVDPEAIAWPDLGYATAYGESFAVFRRLQAEGVLPADVRFQMQYPTPLASINGWFVPEHQDRVEPSYERALFADLDRVLAELPHDQVAVQWDVAVEFAMLEGDFERTDTQSFDAIIDRLVRCVERVPEDVPVGLHLCYGDYQHRHFAEPESLGQQVMVANEVSSRAGRTVNWYSFTVPQYRRDEAFFGPLRELQQPDGTELYFALVPYHPAKQEAGTTADQVRLVEEYLGGSVAWGICTECGMARAEREEVPVLLDLHREILTRHGSQVPA